MRSMAGKSFGMVDSKLKISEKRQNVTVVVRCRPRNDMENNMNSPNVIEVTPERREIIFNSDSLSSIHLNNRRIFTFDKVFDYRSKQIEVYKTVVCPILEEVLEGYSCTIFAYGQTGTGKTYTMEGSRNVEINEYCWDQDPESGIIPRSIHQLFEMLDRNKNISEFSVRVSFLEIYNEELYDLLSCPFDGSNKLRIYNDPQRKGSVFVHQLEEIYVHNKNEVYKILEQGANRRQSASTLLNVNSSRSHTIFSIIVHMKENNIDDSDVFKTGKLYLVDLAGSENIGRSGAINRRAREAGTINQSLLTLGRVITALAEKSKHVPYRESKLTRLLQDSLGGRTKTVLIATISPAQYNSDETLSTLEYASRAKHIQNRPEVNHHIKKDLIKQYTELIEKYKNELTVAREKNGVYLSLESYNILNSNITSQKDQIIELEDKITALIDEMNKLNNLFEEKEIVVKEQQKQLNNAKNWLNSIMSELEIAREKIRNKTKLIHEKDIITNELVKEQRKLFDEATDMTKLAMEELEELQLLNRKIVHIRVKNQNTKEEMEKYEKNMKETINCCYNYMDKVTNEIKYYKDNYNHKIHLFINTLNNEFHNLVTNTNNTCSDIEDLDIKEKNIIDEFNNKIKCNIESFHDKYNNLYNDTTVQLDLINNEFNKNIQYSLANYEGIFNRFVNCQNIISKSITNTNINVKNSLNSTQDSLKLLRNDCSYKFCDDLKKSFDVIYEKFNKEQQEKRRNFVNNVQNIISNFISEESNCDSIFFKEFSNDLSSKIVSENNHCMEIDGKLECLLKSNENLKTINKEFHDENIKYISDCTLLESDKFKDYKENVNNNSYDIIYRKLSEIINSSNSSLIGHSDSILNFVDIFCRELNKFIQIINENIGSFKNVINVHSVKTSEISQSFQPISSDFIDKIDHIITKFHDEFYKYLSLLLNDYSAFRSNSTLECGQTGDTPQLRSSIHTICKPREIEDFVINTKMSENIHTPTPVVSRVALKKLKDLKESSSIPPFDLDIVGKSNKENKHSM